MNPQDHKREATHSPWWEPNDSHCGAPWYWGCCGTYKESRRDMSLTAPVDYCFVLGLLTLSTYYFILWGSRAERMSGDTQLRNLHTPEGSSPPVNSSSRNSVGMFLFIFSCMSRKCGYGTRAWKSRLQWMSSVAPPTVHKILTLCTLAVAVWSVAY